jgi:hypothetical protein
METLTQEHATDGQIRQITRVAEDAAGITVREFFEKELISKEGAQKIHANGNELTRSIRETIVSLLKDLSVSDKYKDEEVESNYGYLSGYKKPKSITEQCNILRQIFPGVGYADEKIAEGELPKHAEGWFAIPKWQTIAPTYAEAVQKVLDAIKTARNGKFHNYREGQITNERLRQTAKTEAMFQKLGDEQNDHNILVVPAQFGIRHRGRSVRRARELMNANECGLGAFAIGIMILTHPERLSHYDDLWIDCAGDEFDHFDSNVGFDHTLYFKFRVDLVRFVTSYVGRAVDSYGSASGFGPQS